MVDFSGLDDKLTVTNLVLALALVVGGGLGANYLMDQEVQQPEQQSIVGDDGDFDTFQPVQELTGFNDLTVTEQALNETGQVDDANVVASFNINETDGETLRYAFGLEVSDTVSDIDAEITPSSDNVASSVELRSVEIVEDESDERSLDEAPVAATLAADSDDEVDEEIGDLSDGDYAVVMEVRSTDVASINTDEDLFDIALEGSGEDNEDVYVTIDNAQ